MDEDKVKSHKELIVWQKAMDLVLAIYELTKNLPREETYCLISQMRRCAISIPSNIAEGRRRGTRNDYKHFLNIAYGSGAELETQVEITRKIYTNLNYITVDSILNEVMRILNTMISKL